MLPPQRSPGDGDQEDGPLTLLLPCPQCGAQAEARGAVYSTRCDHCGSFLIIDRGGQEEIFLVESQVGDDEALRRIVIAYRLEQHRAELLGRYSVERGDGSIHLPEILLEAELKKHEEELLAKVRIVEAHRIEAPYWHLSGTILQGILGRHHDGPKEIRLRAFAVEHTVPGYDTRKSNLRDRGLRLSSARVRPLWGAVEKGRGPFLPWVELKEETHREITTWCTRDIDPDTEPVVKKGEFVFARRVLLYRPCWLARVLLSDQDQSWVLVDGSFASIGGHPSELESRELLQRAVKAPVAGAGRARAYAHASRCPDCGLETSFPPRTLVSVCPNCRLGIEAHPEGIRNVPYDHAEPSWEGPAEYLPFWEFAALLKVKNAPQLTSLEAYARLLYPGPAPDFRIRGKALYVPAFPLLGTEAGDACFQSLVAAVHSEPPRIVDGKVPLGQDALFRGATLSEEEARETLPFLLYAFHKKPSAARLNTLVVKRLLEGVRVSPSPGRLAFLPFLKGESHLTSPALHVAMPLELLEQGPEFDRLRVTVFRPEGPVQRRGAGYPGPRPPR